MKLTNNLVLGVALSLAAAACADGDGANNPDARTSADAAPGTPDAAPGTPDAAPDSPDAMPPDAMGPDAPPPTPSEQIGMARAAADGSVSIDLDGVYVTFVKPLVGSDPAGFFVQHEQTGPALFVAVDPATLTPVPAVGDLVSFTVTEMATSAGARRATMLSGLSVTSSGNDLSGLVQDLSAATDVVSAIGDYEHELVTLTGSIAEDFGSSGTDHVQAQLNTTGVTGDSNLLLRVPATLADTLDLVNTCTLTVGPTPMWRFNSQAQPSAWVAGDLTIATCPEPTVVSAVPLSETSLLVTFDRNIGTVNADGSEFTFDNGLTASAAVASGRTVTVTTSSQVITTTYTLTVAATVLDTRGAGVNAAANTAMFEAYSVPAILRINEINGRIANGCDLLELRVMQGGQMAGITIEERGTTIYTFPSMAVATGDSIIMHWDLNDVANCDNNSVVDETVNKDDQPQSAHPLNFDNAFDVWSTKGGMTNVTNVIGLKAADGTFLDAVMVVEDPADNAVTGSTETAAAEVATANQWQNVGGGQPAGGYLDLDFSANAAGPLTATGNSPAGDTLQRNDDDDNNDKDDWVIAAPSWGTRNSGQTTP